MITTRNSMLQRVLAFILCFALVLVCFPYHPAKAFAIADDVALALLVGALAAVGITSSAPKMADLTQGLQTLLDDWELDRGLASGTLIGQIASTAVALGSGAYQLGNTAWEKISDFVEYLQGDKGLTYGEPLMLDANYSIDFMGAHIPLVDVDAYSAAASSGMRIVRFTTPIELNQTPVDGVTFSYVIGGSTVGYTIFKPASNRFAVHALDVSESDYFYNWLKCYEQINFIYNGELWIAFAGSTTSSTTSDAAYAKYHYRLGDEIPVLSGGAGFTQDYPDSEAPPLPYLPDLPLNVRVPGVAAGDLEGIAAGITDAVNEGDLSAVGSEGADLGDLNGYTLNLSSFFPFCIPFDIYHLITAFEAEPEAPVITIDLDWQLPGQSQTLHDQNAGNSVTIDLSVWDPVAQVLRILELICFIVGLALLTRKVIKW